MINILLYVSFSIEVANFRHHLEIWNEGMFQTCFILNFIKGSGYIQKQKRKSFLTSRSLSGV